MQRILMEALRYSATMAALGFPSVKNDHERRDLLHFLPMTVRGARGWINMEMLAVKHALREERVVMARPHCVMSPPWCDAVAGINIHQLHHPFFGLPRSASWLR